MKVCRGCQQAKPLEQFYAHPKMADGHLNKCIDCVKARVYAHREKNIDSIRQYDRRRSKLDHRVAARIAYMQTDKGKEVKRKACKNYKERFPITYAAHIVTHNALRDGRLIRKESCEQCSSTLFIEAHHDDYTKPLDVRWLCRACHYAWHRNNEPIYV